MRKTLPNLRETRLGPRLSKDWLNLKFASGNHFDFPLLSDTKMAVAVAYGAADSRTAKKARRIAVLINEDGRVARIYDPAGTADFPAKVLADVKKDEL